MTYQRRLLESNPTPKVERLLNSATMDVPTADSKVRTKANALAILREQQLGSTTQLTAFALGGTVSRLLSAVTLVDRPVSALRLALRGAFLGTALGAAALTVIVAHRYLQAPPGSTGSTLAAPQTELATPTLHETQVNRQSSLENTLELAERDLTAKHPQLALEKLDNAAIAPTEEVTRDRATLLRVRSLIALGRRSEAKELADRALAAHPTPTQRQALETLTAGM